MKVVRQAIIGLLVLVMALMSGCGQQAAAPKPAEPKAAPQVLIYLSGLEGDTLDPAHFTSGGSTPPVKHIFDTLVNMKADEKSVQFLPALATKWESSADGKKWTFTLRSGVKFHSGEPFNAQAVKYTFDRILDKAKGLKAYGTYAPIIEKVEVSGDNQVIFWTKSPYGPMLSLISSSSASIVCPTDVEKWGKDWGTHPCGTGAFTYKEWVRDDHMTLAANPNWWDGKPKIDQIVFKPVMETASRLMALEAGQAHIVTGIPPDDIARLEKVKGVKVLKVPSVRIRIIGINTKSPPLNDVRVRQALNYAVDKESMINVLLKGTKVIADSPLPKGAFGYVPTFTYKYDPEKAKALLAAAGFKNGLTLNFLALEQARDPGLMDSLTKIREDLAKVGIQTKYEITDINAYLAKLEVSPEVALKQGKQLYAQGGGAGTFDADVPMRDYFSTAAWTPKGTNRGYYSNPRVDKLLEIGMTSVDQKTRLDAYKEAQQIIMDECPWIFLYTETVMFGVRDTVSGIETVPSDYLLLHKASLTPPK
jgi:peptide/nickel transport system substrate-binding protein